MTNSQTQYLHNNNDPNGRFNDFFENGYKVFPPNQKFLKIVDEARLAFEAFKKQNAKALIPAIDEHGFYRRLVNLHVAVPELQRLFSENPSLPLLDNLFGEAILYTSLYFEAGSSQDIHRDTPYFWTSPGYAYVGVWVALEDVHELNGPLRVVKGGHALPELNLKAIRRKFFADDEAIDPFSPQLWDEYQAQVQQSYENADLKEQDLHVSKGSTIVWHAQLPHGGAPIINKNLTRNSLVMHSIPLDFAVSHQAKFFDEKPLQSKYEYEYIVSGRRRCISYDSISVAHATNISINDIK